MMILRRHLSIFLVFFFSFSLICADNESEILAPSKQAAQNSLNEEQWTLSKTARRRLAVMCAAAATVAYMAPIIWHFSPKANWVEDSQNLLLFLKIYQLLNCDIARSFMEGYSRLAIKSLVPKLGFDAPWTEMVGHAVDYFVEELRKQGVNVDAGQPIFDTGSALYHAVVNKYNFTRLIENFHECRESICPITEDGYNILPEIDPAAICDEEIPPQFKVLSPVPDLSPADLNATVNLTRLYDSTDHNNISPAILTMMAGPVIAIAVFFLVEELGKKYCSKKDY